MPEGSTDLPSMCLHLSWSFADFRGPKAATSTGRRRTRLPSRPSTLPPRTWDLHGLEAGHAGQEARDALAALGEGDQAAVQHP